MIAVDTFKISINNINPIVTKINIPIPTENKNAIPLPVIKKINNDINSNNINKEKILKFLNIIYNI